MVKNVAVHWELRQVVLQPQSLGSSAESRQVLQWNVLHSVDDLPLSGFYWCLYFWLSKTVLLFASTPSCIKSLKSFLPPEKKKRGNGFEIWFALNTAHYEKLMLASRATVIKTVIITCFCLHAGDLWLWCVSLEAGASYCRSDLFWWLSPPPPLLDAPVACESNVQKDCS